MISGNTIRSNSAYSGGGGAYCHLGSLSILGNSITDNWASDGGGIDCDLGWAEISDNTISGNRAGSHGGGIFTFWTGDIFVTNNQIVGNSSWSAGGGICSDYGGAISNNMIVENTTWGVGGGIFCGYATPFNNNTIVGNVAGGLGGGIHTWSDSLSEIIDSIIWNNGDDLYNCTAMFCCVQDPDEGEGNIHDDPMFIDGPYGGYYLRPDSPCTDAGSRSAEDAGLPGMTTQLDGTPDTGRVDMGCHYRIPATHRPVAHIDSISPNPATQGVDTVEFIGHATDDGRITRYEWGSNLDGLLSDEQAFFVLHAAYLSLGTHTISFSVWDDEYQRSGPVVAELTILPCPFEEVYVDAQSGDDSNYGSETAPFKTIAHALGCVHGAQEKPVTVHVAAGTYSASSNGECFPLDMKSWVSVIGEGADTTKLDAEGGARHVITCQSVDDLWIAGFTIAGGHADGFKDYDGDGGAILCNDSSPTIWGNTIAGNWAYSGAGISCYDSSPTISNNTIVGNVVPYGDGGGIECHWSSPTIQGNTIADNSAGYGGAVSCYYGSPTITDCIIWNNGDDLWGCSADYCCVEDSHGGEGNINDDPMFVPGPFGDYYLDPQSPCIDAGSRSAEAAGLSGMTTQADGTPDTGRVDMGVHYPIP
ncbi:MAG: DUF1565 domain-containing protein [Candidatus Coatesbacteria bacterium]|nr:DUF1565 domain-containing protein [Candidatus Coatesbacteria bacterium]